MTLVFLLLLAPLALENLNCWHTCKIEAADNLLKTDI